MYSTITPLFPTISSSLEVISHVGRFCTVSMVDMALKELAEKQVLVLDDERKAAMVSNLMVVLCGESEVHPVLNTGTLYN
jgi:hypothetical protein